MKFKCHNCGKIHKLYGTAPYKCGQITLSFNLIIMNKIDEIEERIRKIEEYTKKYELFSICKKIAKKMLK